MKKQISVIARVCGISAKTCSLTMPSYFHVWEALASTLQTSVGKKRGSSLPSAPSLGLWLHPRRDRLCSMLQKMYPKRTVSPFPHSVPTSKSEALLQV